MFGSCIEESVYVKGLCEVAVDHPLVDVDHLGLCMMPDDPEFPSVLTCLITVRLKADELIEYKARQFTSGRLSVWLVGPDELRSLNAQQSNTNFWKQDAKPQLYRNVNSVSVADFSHRYQMMIGPCPMLQFIGAVSVKSATASGHRRSIQRPGR